MKTVVQLKLSFLLFFGLLNTGLKAQEASSENLMATFIYNFTNYVEWDKPSSDSVFNIVILGDGKLDKPLQYIASIKMVGQKKIRIIQSENQSAPDQCDLLFVPEAQIELLENYNSHFPEHQTLIISATENGLEKGAMINFTNLDGKIGFEINHTAIRNQGLKVSSRLLKIAVKVI
ncbi:MAG: YfiR family protein [Bacteroidales bacterium]|jgi:hypothetical protein|nr:YfiR family protein [Bacteroidales bacterium]